MGDSDLQMNLFFLAVCLVVVLLTLENLIVSGFYTYSHRLLPLILGLLALYDFYLIVEYLTGYDSVFIVLKDLLLVQLLDVILFYIVDFLKIKLNAIGNIMIVIALFGMDFLIFTNIHNPESYRGYMKVFAVISVFSIVLLSIRGTKDKKFPKQTKHDNNVMFLALLIPAVALILCIFGIVRENIFLPLAIDATCLILDFMFVTDRLRDVDSLLKEEHFHTLNVPAFLFDQDLFFLDASQKARELFPYNISQIERSPHLFAEQENLRELMENDGALTREINGRFYHCELQKAYYKGKMKGYILTFMDITEEKNETDMAKELARQKSDFLASMSHDLRSPLHAIIGSSEIVLSRVEMSERTRVMVNHIHEAGKHLLDIVNSILDFSKLESGNLKLHPKKYNFTKLMEEQAQIAFANVKGKPVKFSFRMMDNFPEYLYGDGLRVKQIMQNLISNAIKFTDKGSVSCKMEARIENGQKVRICFTVKDTGTGMSEKQIRNVFKDYVTYAFDERKEGTGLGLSIVKKLAEMMDGTAWAESDGESGTIVFADFVQELTTEDIELLNQNKLKLQSPFFIQDESALGQNNGWRNTAMPSYVYPNAKVLLVDDMQVNCEIFKQIASPWQFMIDTAVNGKEAVEMVKKNHYDLIFLDQMMPVMTGTEAADEIKKLTDTVMILLTANITEQMREESKLHGFSSFMQKPIDIDRLKVLLEKYLPVSLRKEVDFTYSSLINNERKASKGYMKSLSTYISEMKELYEKLPEYVENDPEMFHNKVHGIKGVSRQIGKEHIALMAEIIEMAAATGNKDFIHRYFDTFYGDLEMVISSCEKELAELMQKEELNEDGEMISKKKGTRIAPEKEIAQLFVQLKQALEEYEMSNIEEILEELGEIKLDLKIKEVYESVVALYEDMEYEEALQKIKELGM